MAHKRKQHPPPIEDPPTASSSESEEDDEEAPPSQPHAAAAAAQVSSSGEEEDSSQEEEDEQPSTILISANPLSNPQPKISSSESESDTDSEPTRAKRIVKNHDKIVFEFSRKVWDEGANGLVEKPKPSGKAAAKSSKKEVAIKNAKKLKANEPQELSAPPEPGNHDGGAVSFLYREMSRFQPLDEVDMKRGLALMEESKRKELLKKWKILRHSEMEVLANRYLLIGEQIQLVSESLQSPNY